MRWGRQKQNDKHENSDCQTKVQTVTTNMSKTTRAPWLGYNNTVTVFQSKTKILWVIFQSFITGSTIGNELKVFVGFIPGECWRAWFPFQIWSSIKCVPDSGSRSGGRLLMSLWYDASSSDGNLAWSNRTPLWNYNHNILSPLTKYTLFSDHTYFISILLANISVKITLLLFVYILFS